MKKFSKKQFVTVSLNEKRTAKGCNNRPRLVHDIIYTLTATLGCLFLFSACEKSELENNVQVAFESEPELPGVYPMVQTATRSGDNGFWEDWDFITLYTGQKVTSPWNPVSTTSAAPYDILGDIKYIDGWDLIYYILDDTNEGGDYTKNSPYLIFHNRYTGILKVFCYLAADAFSPNNHGIWEIQTDTPSSLFAFQSTPISKISEKQNKVYNVSNITKNSSHGFSIGWNCFQIEMAYDPSQSGRLCISTVASNSVDLSFSGNLQAETNGLMTTSTGSNNYGSGIAKMAGDEAGTWIKNKINDKTILGIPTSLVSEGVKALVKGGVGSIIGAVTGLFRSDNSTKSLQLTTNGTFSFKGQATFVSTTGISDLQFSIDPSLVGYLGVWGLKEEPTLLFSPYAVLKSPQEYTNGYTREYRTDIINSVTSKASIVYNPTLSKYNVSKTLTTDYFQTTNVTRYNVFGSLGSVGRDPRNQNKVYDNLYKPSLSMIADVAFTGAEGYHLSVDQFDPPMDVFIPNVPGGPNGALPQFRYNSCYVATVGVKLTLANGSEAYSYHQCYPKIDWNFSEYNNGFYWSIYPCEPVMQLNSLSLTSPSINLMDERIIPAE